MFLETSLKYGRLEALGWYGPQEVALAFSRCCCHLDGGRWVFKTSMFVSENEPNYVQDQMCQY